MALSNMVVFNETLQTATIETLAQMVDKFNAASGGTITLTTQGFEGDFRQEAFWKGIHAAQRRVDRYASNTSASPTSLEQLQEVGVKVAGGFGPILWEPGQLTWIQKDPDEAVSVISENLAEAIMQDQLNTVIASLVAGITQQGAATTVDASAAVSYVDMNNAHALFGDHSMTILANVMDGTSYHAFIGQNLNNANDLFQSTGVRVVDILGKLVVVTDAPALRVSGSGAEATVLGLVANAGTVYDGSSLITNVETNNGNQRIETTFQADYDFGVALKGYRWDTSAGGKSPTDAELGTGSNWVKVATDIKHTAGVAVVADLSGS